MNEDFSVEQPSGSITPALPPIAFTPTTQPMTGSVPAPVAQPVDALPPIGVVKAGLLDTQPQYRQSAQQAASQYGTVADQTAQQAIQQTQQANTSLANDAAHLRSGSLSQMDANAQQQQQLSAQAQEYAKTEGTKLQGQIDDIRNSKIDPFQWFNDKSFGQKLAIGLGALGFALYGAKKGGSPVVGLGVVGKMIDQAVDTSVSLQKEALNRKQTAFQDSSNLYARNLQTYKDQTAALQATRIQLQEHLVNGLELLANQHGGELFQAAATTTLANLRQKQAKDVQDFQQTITDNGFKSAELDLRRQAFALSAQKTEAAMTKAEEARLKLPNPVQEAVSTNVSVAAAAQQAIDIIQKSDTWKNPTSDEYAQLKFLQTKIAGEVAKATLSRVSTQEFTRFSEVLGNIDSWKHFFKGAVLPNQMTAPLEHIVKDAQGTATGRMMLAQTDKATAKAIYAEQFQNMYGAATTTAPPKLSDGDNLKQRQQLWDSEVQQNGLMATVRIRGARPIQ